MTKVTWEEIDKSYVGRAGVTDPKPFQYSGDVVGCVRRWFRAYLVVSCLDGVIREVKKSKVKIIPSQPSADLIERSEKQFTALMEKIEELKTYKGGLVGIGIQQDKIMNQERLYDEIRKMQTLLEFDYPTKIKKGDWVVGKDGYPTIPCRALNVIGTTVFFLDDKEQIGRHASLMRRATKDELSKKSPPQAKRKGRTGK